MAEKETAHLKRDATRDWLWKQLAERDEEVRRLREALEEITDFHYAWDTHDGSWDEERSEAYEMVKDIARRALAPEDVVE